jgi:hypothetical protein
MAEGWIKLHRQLIDSEWFTDVNTNHLFMYCLIRANHKDAKWQGLDIGRGQFVTSLDSLSKATGLTVRQIRTSLKKLITTSNLTSNSTNKYRLITVTNYDTYQDDDRQVDKPATSQRQSDDKPATTDKNNNNNKNENNNKNQGDILDSFDIEKHLNDSAREAAKKKAPGWDLYYLMPIYNDWIKGKAMPSNPAGAFINWCGTYTKGKQL